MQMIRIALRNVFRHKGRTAMTLAAIAVGVAAMILSGGFVRDVFVQLGEAVIHSQTGHLQIARAGYFTHGSRSPSKYLLEDVEAVARVAAAVPGVADVMGRLEFSGLLNNGRTDLAIVAEGVDPEREAKLGTHVHLVSGRQLSQDAPFGVLLGEGVARAMNLTRGDRASIVVSSPDGAANVLEFEIAGVFRSFSKDYDARAVKIVLPSAQELLNTPSVNRLVVALARTQDTTKVAGRLRERLGGSGLEIRTWTELNDFYEKTVQLYERQFGVLQLIILTMVVLSVANTVNMTMFERVGEFGTMRALGNRGSQVFGMVVTESLLLGVVGATIGVALGVAAALGISAVGIPMPPPPNANLGYVALIRLVPEAIATAFAAGVGATLLAALIPAVRIAGIPVAAALRQNI